MKTNRVVAIETINTMKKADINMHKLPKETELKLQITMTQIHENRNDIPKGLSVFEFEKVLGGYGGIQLEQVKYTFDVVNTSLQHGFQPVRLYVDITPLFGKPCFAKFSTMGYSLLSPKEVSFTIIEDLRAGFISNQDVRLIMRLVDKYI